MRNTEHELQYTQIYLNEAEELAIVRTSSPSYIRYLETELGLTPRGELSDFELFEFCDELAEAREGGNLNKRKTRKEYVLPKIWFKKPIRPYRSHWVSEKKEVVDYEESNDTLWDNITQNPF